MILKCPECAARYAIPDHAIGVDGRDVRCAKCKHSWHENPPQTLEGKQQAELDAMLDNANEQTKEKPVPKGSNVPTVKTEPATLGTKITTFGFAAIAAALALLIFTPSLIGFTPSKGLILSDVTMETRSIKGMSLFEIKGKFKNITNQTLKVPILRVELIDKRGSAVRYWEFSEKGAALDAEQTMDFTTGELGVTTLGDRFVVELGNRVELTLRNSPDKIPEIVPPPIPESTKPEDSYNEQ